MRLVIVIAIVLGLITIGGFVLSSKAGFMGKKSEDTAETTGETGSQVNAGGANESEAGEAVLEPKKAPWFGGLGGAAESGTVPGLPSAGLAAGLEQEPLVWMSYKFKKRAVPPWVRESGIGGGTVVIDDGSRTVAVEVTKDQVGAVTALLAGMDTELGAYQVDMVLCVARLTDGADFSWDWALSLGPDLPAVSDGSARVSPGSLEVSAGGFELVLDRAVSSGSLDVLSRPSLLVEDGESASFVSGREVGVGTSNSANGNLSTSVEFREVALRVDVLVGFFGGRYRVAVDQRNDDVVGGRLINGSEVPEVSTEQLKTVVYCVPSEWVAIGGVRINTERKQRGRGIVPFLGGSRQSSLERQEIAIFLRVSPHSGSGGLKPPVADSVLSAPLPIVEVGPPEARKPILKRIFGKSGAGAPAQRGGDPLP